MLSFQELHLLMDGNVVQLGESITSRGLAAGRAPVVRYQGVTSLGKLQTEAVVAL